MEGASFVVRSEEQRVRFLARVALGHESIWNGQGRAVILPLVLHDVVFWAQVGNMCKNRRSTRQGIRPQLDSEYLVTSVRYRAVRQV